MVGVTVRRRGRISTLLALALLAGCGGTAGSDTAETAVVASVTDGDTIVLEDGRRVRLVQIDAPELREQECYGEEASRMLARILRPGGEVQLVADPGLDDTDDYGRLLRYVFEGGRNLNLVLVRQGAATVYFFRGDRGLHAEQLLVAARAARDDERGLWGACPGTPFEPERGADTGTAQP